MTTLAETAQTTTGGADMVLAHHAIVAALPFVVPTMLITLLVVVMAVRDRHRNDPAQDGEDGPPAAAQ